MSTQAIQQPSRAMSPPNPPPARAASAAAQNAPNALMQSVSQAAYQQQQATILQSSTSSSISELPTNGATSPPPGPGSRAMSPSQGSSSVGGSRGIDASKAPKKGGPPQRPRRDDDESYGVNGEPSRPMSPTVDGRPPPLRSGSAGPSQNSPTQGNFGPSSSSSRVTSPVNPGNPLANFSESERNINGSSAQNFASPQSTSSGFVQQQQQPPRSNIPLANLRAHHTRSPSPVINGEAQQLHNSGGSSAPPDAFYNPRSPGIGGVMGGHARQGSLSGMAGAELMRELKAKDVEIENSRRRERWLKLEVGRAMKAGFLVDEVGGEVSKEELGSSSSLVGEEGSETRVLAEGLMRLKKEKAKLEVSLSLQSARSPTQAEL